MDLVHLKTIRQCAVCGVWEFYQELLQRWDLYYRQTGYITIRDGHNEYVCTDERECLRRSYMKMDWRDYEPNGIDLKRAR